MWLKFKEIRRHQLFCHWLIWHGMTLMRALDSPQTPAANMVPLVHSSGMEIFLLFFFHRWPILDPSCLIPVRKWLKMNVSIHMFMMCENPWFVCDCRPSLGIGIILLYLPVMFSRIGFLQEKGKYMALDNRYVQSCDTLIVERAHVTHSDSLCYNIPDTPVS